MKFLLSLALVAFIGFAVAQDSIDEVSTEAAENVTFEPTQEVTEEDIEDVTQETTEAETDEATEEATEEDTDEVTDGTTEEDTDEATEAPKPEECPEGYRERHLPCVTVCTRFFRLPKVITHPKGTPCRLGQREGQCDGRFPLCRPL